MKLTLSTVVLALAVTQVQAYPPIPVKACTQLVLITRTSSLSLSVSFVLHWMLAVANIKPREPPQANITIFIGFTQPPIPAALTLLPSSASPLNSSVP